MYICLSVRAHMQLPMQLVQAKISPESVGLRKPPKHTVPHDRTPTEVTRDFINDLHDYIMDERRYLPAFRQRVAPLFSIGCHSTQE